MDSNSVSSPCVCVRATLSYLPQTPREAITVLLEGGAWEEAFRVVSLPAISWQLHEAGRKVVKCCVSPVQMRKMMHRIGV